MMLDQITVKRSLCETAKGARCLWQGRHSSGRYRSYIILGIRQGRGNQGETIPLELGN